MWVGRPEFRSRVFWLEVMLVVAGLWLACPAAVDAKAVPALRHMRPTHCRLKGTVGNKALMFWFGGCCLVVDWTSVSLRLLSSVLGLLGRCLISSGVCFGHLADSIAQVCVRLRSQTRLTHTLIGNCVLRALTCAVETTAFLLQVVATLPVISGAILAFPLHSAWAAVLSASLLFNHLLQISISPLSLLRTGMGLVRGAVSVAWVLCRSSVTAAMAFCLLLLRILFRLPRTLVLVSILLCMAGGVEGVGVGTRRVYEGVPFFLALPISLLFHGINPPGSTTPSPSASDTLDMGMDVTQFKGNFSVTKFGYGIALISIHGCLKVYRMSSQPNRQGPAFVAGIRDGDEVVGYGEDYKHPSDGQEVMDYLSTTIRSGDGSAKLRIRRRGIAKRGKGPRARSRTPSQTPSSPSAATPSSSTPSTSAPNPTFAHQLTFNFDDSLASGSYTEMTDLPFTASAGQPRLDYFMADNASAQLDASLLGDGAGEFHKEIITPGSFLDQIALFQFTESVKNSGILSPDWDVLNTVNFAFNGTDAALYQVPSLHHRPHAKHTAVIATVNQHFVVMYADKEQADSVFVFDSLQGYISESYHGDKYREYLTKVGATLLRKTGTRGTKVLFVRVPQQDPLGNSCGAYAAFNLYALVNGERPDAFLLGPQKEVQLRRALHDTVFLSQGGYAFETMHRLMEGSRRVAAIAPTQCRARSPPSSATCLHCRLGMGGAQPRNAMDWAHSWDATIEPGSGSSTRINPLVSSTPLAMPPIKRPLPPVTSQLGNPLSTPKSAKLSGDSVRRALSAVMSSAGAAVSSAAGTAITTAASLSGDTSEYPWSQYGVSSKGLRPLRDVKTEIGLACRKRNVQQFECSLLKRPGVGPLLESTCPYCGAQLFAAEAGAKSRVTRQWCCGGGSARAPSMSPFQATFYDESFPVPGQAGFIKQARTLNHLFAMAVVRVQGQFVKFTPGPHFVKILGRTYHTTHSLDAVLQCNQSSFCVDDGSLREEAGQRVPHPPTKARIREVQAYLYGRNALFKAYNQLAQCAHIDGRLTFERTTRRTHGTVLGTQPTGDLIAGIISQGKDRPQRSAVVWKQGARGVESVPVRCPEYETLAYPLLYVDGESGWYPGMPPEPAGAPLQRDVVPNHLPHGPQHQLQPPQPQQPQQNPQPQMTFMQYLRNRILTVPRFTGLGTLSQEWAVDMWSRREDMVLDWIRHNQDKTRRATRDELAEALGEQVPEQAGRLFLPTSFTASPRWYLSNFHDAMATVARLGAPDVFLTMTTDPAWPEIQPRGCPAATNRVFKIKQDKLMEDLKMGRVFEGHNVKYVSRVTEFQKRGLPHCHVILKLDPPLAPEEIDKYFSAEIPGTNQPRLRELVLRHNLHGPCGKQNKGCPCMDPDVNACTKGFPKSPNPDTYTDDRGYTILRRRCRNEAEVQRRGRTWRVTDCNVVAYNPYLTLRYSCHINAEVAGTVHVVKYLFKYVYKGPDRSLVALSDANVPANEINDYVNSRYLSAAEATYRIFEFGLFSRSPAVQAVSVHLPGKDAITYVPAQAAAALSTKSKLERYLHRPVDSLPQLHNLKLTEYYEDYYDVPTAGARTIPHRDGGFITPRVKGDMILRIYWVSPMLIELYYLRQLLIHYAASSWDELRTVGGTTYPTFQEAAQARGLVSTDVEFREAIEEASIFSSGAQLRRLFVSMLLGLGPPAAVLWGEMWAELAEDYRHRLGDDVRARNAALRDISAQLRKHGKTLASSGLPEAEADPTDLEIERSLWQGQSFSAVASQLSTLNKEQAGVVNTIVRAALGDQAGIGDLVAGVGTLASPPLFGYLKLFLDAPAGTGKTYALNLVAAIIRRSGGVVITVASTGIAALKYPQGTTAHSMFGLPLDPTGPDDISTLSIRSQRAELIRNAAVIILDEAPMLHRYHLDALFNLLRELKSSNLRCLVLGGDWRQCTPVIRYGGKLDILRASIRFSPRFTEFKTLRLVENVRARADPAYASFLMKVGNGELPHIQLQPGSGPVIALDQVDCTTDPKALLNFTFPNFADPYAGFRNAILCGTNEELQGINLDILARLPGPTVTLLSADAAMDSEGNPIPATIEFLSSLSDVGVPPHALQLKVGAVVMVMRNLNFSQGICNSTKGIVKEITQLLVKIEIPSDDGTSSRIALIPRIKFRFSAGKKGVNVERTQFPIRLAWAITFNRSQAQTLEKVGIDLRNQVFGHGQLYVILGRAQRARDVLVLVNKVHRGPGGVPYAKNVVYPELITGRMSQSALGGSQGPSRAPSPDFSDPTACDPE